MSGTYDCDLLQLSKHSLFLLLVTLSGLQAAENKGVQPTDSNQPRVVSLTSSSSVQPKAKASNDDSKEKLQTASQSLFGYNQNGQTNGLYSGGSFGGFSGNGNGFGQPFGSNTFAGSGVSSGINSNGFGAFAGNRDNTGLFTGTNSLNGFSGLGGPTSGGFGQFNSFNGQGFYPGSNSLGSGGFGGSNGLYSGQGGLFNNNGLYQNSLYQNGGGFNSFPQFGNGGFTQLGGGTFGGTQDRNLGFVNQAFGNPLYNRSPPVTNVQPNLGSLQVGNRIDVNNQQRGQFGNYVPSGGPGGFSIQNGQQQGSPSGLYPGFGNPGQLGGVFGGGGGFQGSRGFYPGGGFNNNSPNPFLTLDYLNNRTPLRGNAGGLGNPTTTVPPRGNSRLGAGRASAPGNSRFNYPSGPSSYPGRGERLHRFTSNSDEDSKK